MRKEIIAMVARLDKSFLRVVHSMMLTYTEEREELEKQGPVIDHTIDGTPIREKAFYEAADKEVEKVLAGGGTPAAEVFEKKEQWLKSIK